LTRIYRCKQRGIRPNIQNKYFLLGQGSVYLKYNSEAEKFEPAKVSIEIELLS